MNNILEKNNLIKMIQIGKIVEGKIIGKEKLKLFLDLGPIGTGVIYGKELQKSKEQIKGLKTGSVLNVKIIELENEEGYIELSLDQAYNEIIWKKLEEKKEKGEILKVKISGSNKGGLLTEVFGILAFIPVSQLSPENYPRVEKGDASKIATELQKFIEQEMEVKVFSIDSKEKKLILSEKAKQDEKMKEILKNYNVGDIVEGKISGITSFGVFIKISGREDLEGLIHISELDWQLVEDPADIVKAGQTVKAKIISISDNKIALSLKALKQDPWEDIDKKYKKGDTFEGKITKFNPFGVFVQVSPKIQGLCHISEFGTKTKMEETLSIGKKYKFQILSIDPKEHKMSLKLA